MSAIHQPYSCQVKQFWKDFQCYFILQDTSQRLGARKLIEYKTMLWPHRTVPYSISNKFSKSLLVARVQDRTLTVTYNHHCVRAETNTCIVANIKEFQRFHQICNMTNNQAGIHIYQQVGSNNFLMKKKINKKKKKTKKKNEQIVLSFKTNINLLKLVLLIFGTCLCYCS